MFLKLSAAAGLVLGLPGTALALFKKRFPVRTVEADDFRFDPATGMVRYDGRGEEPYRLVIDGLVKKPVSLTYPDLKSLPRTEQVSDFHCVEGWSVADTRWGGFRFQEVLNRVEPAAEARYAVFHSLGQTRHKPKGQTRYIESLPVARLTDPKAECLLVLDRDGEPLTHDHGAPLRLISPFDLAYKGAKYVTRIELAAKPRPGWWTLANPIYPIDAPVPAYRLRGER